MTVKHHRILIVDDDPALRHSLLRAFRKQPFSILVAESTKEALKLIDSVELDLVLSDEHMPGGNGTELLRMVRESDPSVVRMLLTGTQDVADALPAVNDGLVHRHFRKPCDTLRLATEIRRALHERDLSR